MFNRNRIFHCLSLLSLYLPLLSFAATPVPSMVIFGDSLSDNGNTTHLLKSLRQEESPAYLVAPFKAFVLNKMIDFADEYYVPQMVLDAGISVVTNFFDTELAPYIANLVSKIRLVPILPGNPYWNSRFSNGPVWNEYLAKICGLDKSDEAQYINKAFAGSWAATYAQQLTVWNLIRHPLASIKTLIVGKLVPPSLGFTVQAYLMEHKTISTESIYFIFSGTNDYLNILQFEDNYNPAIMSVYVDNVLDNLSAAVLKLAKSGANRFVIMGIPRIGDMPRFVKTTDKEVLNSAALQHNERLHKRIDEWKKLYPKADFLFVSTADSLAMTAMHPEQHGFTNASDACIDVEYPMYRAVSQQSPFINNLVMNHAEVIQYRDPQFLPGNKNYRVCDNPENYMYWDEIHIATKAHNYLALDVCSAMKAHGYEVRC